MKFFNSSSIIIILIIWWIVFVFTISATHLWTDHSTGTAYLNLQFYIKCPPSLEESPREPSPIDEEPTPGEGEEDHPEEEGSAPHEEEERRSDVVDGRPKCKSADEPNYKYRLARVVKDYRVVAIHVSS